MSLPRLELCAAVLLVRLVKRVREIITVEDSKVFAYSDLTVVLHWLKSQPSEWKVFVANRVAEVQGGLPVTSWRHVRSEANPADTESRAVLLNNSEQRHCEGMDYHSFNHRKCPLHFQK